MCDTIPPPKTPDELLKEAQQVQMERSKSPWCREQDKPKQSAGIEFQDVYLR